MSANTPLRTQQISVARQFSRFPAGRFVADGPFSGQAFRDTFLVPAMKANKPLLVDLDGTAGFGSSFLEEAFGGLVRLGWSPDAVLSNIEFKCSDPSIAEEVLEYVRNASPKNV